MAATATPEQDMSAKYFLQLMKTATLEDFLRESADYFSKLKSAEIFKKKENVNNSDPELLPIYREVAEVFSKEMRLAQEFSVLPTNDQLVHMVRNPFLWDPLTIKVLIENSKNGTEDGYVVAAGRINQWLDYLVAFDEMCQKAFWNSFFSCITETTHFLPGHQQTRMFGFVNMWFEVKVLHAKTNEEISKRGLSYFLFLNSYAKAATALLGKRKENESDIKQLLLRILNTVGYHPYMIDAVHYQFKDQISASMVDTMVQALFTRIDSEHCYFSWALYRKSFSALNHIMFHKNGEPRPLEELINYVTKLNELIDAVVARAERKAKAQAANGNGALKSREEYCHVMRSDVGSYYQNKRDILDKVMSNMIWPVSQKLKITTENLSLVADFQALYYSEEWNKQFEKITPENFKLAICYVGAMDGAMKRVNRGWHRDDVLGYIVNSEPWKQLSVDEAIDFYKQFCSPVLYKSILGRPDTELPFEWMREKHLLSLCKQK